MSYLILDMLSLFYCKHPRSEAEVDVLVLNEVANLASTVDKVVVSRRQWDKYKRVLEGMLTSSNLASSLRTIFARPKLRIVHAGREYELPEPIRIRGGPHQDEYRDIVKAIDKYLVRCKCYWAVVCLNRTLGYDDVELWLKLEGVEHRAEIIREYGDSCVVLIEKEGG